MTTGQILDNRYLIADLIKCQPATLRYVPEEAVDIFEIQERVIPDKVALRNIMQNPNFDHGELIELRKFVDQPMPNVHIRTLRDAYTSYTTNRLAEDLLSAIRSTQEKMGEIRDNSPVSSASIRREDLYLICFDYAWS